MSNYAPNPKKQKIYNNLAQKRLDDVTASDIQTQTNPVFIQAENQDDLITMNIINKAAMRDGSPMPKTMTITSTTVAYDDNSNSTEFKLVLAPNKGEVYQLLGAQSSVSGGTVGTSIFWGTELSSLTALTEPSVLIAQESSTGSPAFSPLLYGAQIFFDENVHCFMNGYSMSAGESTTLKVAFIRVR